MSIFRDKSSSIPSGERASASPPSGAGVIHIAELAAQVAARNVVAPVVPSPAQARSSYQLQSGVRHEARKRAVKLVRGAFRPISFSELACVVDVQPQHVSLALSDEPTKPFALEHLLLVAERRPDWGVEVAKAYSEALPTDAVELLGHDLIRIAQARRAKEGRT
jgi:hypothetical protein